MVLLIDNKLFVFATSSRRPRATLYSSHHPFSDFFFSVRRVIAEPALIVKALYSNFHISGLATNCQFLQRMNIDDPLYSSDVLHCRGTIAKSSPTSLHSRAKVVQ